MLAALAGLAEDLWLVLSWVAGIDDRSFGESALSPVRVVAAVSPSLFCNGSTLLALIQKSASFHKILLVIVLQIPRIEDDVLTIRPARRPRTSKFENHCAR